MPVIAADAAQTAARIRREADHLRELGVQAGRSLESAADRAVEVGAQVLSRALEGVAAQVHGKIDEFFGSFRIVADDVTPRDATPTRKQLKP
jgi:hypothetical protein